MVVLLLSPPARGCEETIEASARLPPLKSARASCWATIAATTESGLSPTITRDAARSIRHSSADGSRESRAGGFQEDEDMETTPTVLVALASMTARSGATAVVSAVSTSTEVVGVERGTAALGTGKVAFFVLSELHPPTRVKGQRQSIELARTREAFRRSRIQ